LTQTPDGADFATVVERVLESRYDPLGPFGGAFEFALSQRALGVLDEETCGGDYEFAASVLEPLGDGGRSVAEQFHHDTQGA